MRWACIMHRSMGWRKRKGSSARPGALGSGKSGIDFDGGVGGYSVQYRVGLESEYGMVWFGFGFWEGWLLDESVSVSGFAEPEIVERQMPR